MKKKTAVLFLAVALLASQNVLASKAETGEESAGDAAVAAEAVEGEALAEGGVEETQETAPQEIQAAEESVENTLAAYAEQTTNPAEEIMEEGTYTDANGKEMYWKVTADRTLTYSGNGMAENIGMVHWYWLGPEKVVLEEGVTGIDDYGIGSSWTFPASLKEIYIPESVTEIGVGAFFECSGLERISLPSKITIIDDDTFYSCTNLKEIEILGGVTKIGASAFALCESLGKMNLPDGLEEIGEYAFTCCTNLERIDLPDKITSIESNVFEGCESLKEIKLSNGLTKIGRKAFFGCGSLAHITIPSGVREIGDFAFNGCWGLQEVIFKGNAPTIIDDSGYYIMEPFYRVTATAYYPAGNPTWTEEARMAIGSELNWIAYGDLQILPEVTDNVYVIGGADGATIACSGEFKDFVDVYMDDVLVDKGNYMVAEGSTILTFVSKYLDTLSVGKHKVTLNYTYGSVDTQLEILAYGSGPSDTGEAGLGNGSNGTSNSNGYSINEASNGDSSGAGAARITKASPQTGDEKAGLPLVFLAFAFASGCIAVWIRKKRCVVSIKISLRKRK